MAAPGTQLVIAYGAGVNSTAMIIGLYNRNINPDLILFADTGGERPETYAFIWRFSRWLHAHGMTGITIVRNDGKHITLEQECLTQRILPSLAYGWRKCSDKYKIRPQEKFCKGYQKYTKAIGFDFGEQHRAFRFRGDVDTGVYEKWFPLIEWQWGRKECVDAIERVGLCVPPKSACFYCPASTKKEVLALSRTHPVLFARAVEIERNAANGLRTIKGLGRHWSWEQIVLMDDAQLRLLPDPPVAVCACRDGWDGEEE